MAPMPSTSTDDLIAELGTLTDEIADADADTRRRFARRRRVWMMLRRRGITGMALAEASGVSQPVVVRETKGWDQ